MMGYILLPVHKGSGPCQDLGMLSIDAEIPHSCNSRGKLLTPYYPNLCYRWPVGNSFLRWGLSPPLSAALFHMSKNIWLRLGTAPEPLCNKSQLFHNQAREASKEALLVQIIIQQIPHPPPSHAHSGILCPLPQKDLV